MPENMPQNGDVYYVYRATTLAPTTLGKPSRPMACVAMRQPESETWKAMGRSSTDGSQLEGDIFSPAQPSLKLDKDGHWSLRWLHDVLRDKTGTPACAFRGELIDPEKDQVLTLYRNRNK